MKCSLPHINKIFLALFFLLHASVNAATYGSDTAVSIVNPFNITGQDNIIKTFGAAINGFAFLDSTVSCSFGSIYPVAGPINLRGGRLHLQRDLVLSNTGSLADLGTIIGQDHAVELSEGSNSFASITNPSGARTLALVARLTESRYIESADWSYDNKYLAAVTTNLASGSELFIYSFNGSTLTRVASANLGNSGNSVRWRPNSYYLATASNNTSALIRVYLFNSATNTLTRKDTKNPTGSNFRAVAWQGRGSHLAVGGSAVYVYRFNSGTELLDTLYTPTNNAALNGSVEYDCMHWAPVGNKDDFIVGTNGGSLHLYNFTGAAITHLKRYDQGTRIEAVDWAPTSTYMAVGFSTGSVKTYQHTASIDNITYKASSASFAASAYSLSWKPNAQELTVGLASFAAGYEHQIFTFNQSSYALTNAYNIDVSGGVFCVRYSNSDGTYIARADNTTRYLSVYKESYSPLIFKDIHLFLNSNLTIGAPLTFIGDCTINGRGNSMTFTGDGTINVATNSLLDISNSNLFFKRPNAFAMQGKTSRLIFRDSKIGLDSDVLFGDGSWETYNDVVVTGPHTFAYSTANTSTIHSNAYLTFNNGATFEIGKNNGGQSSSSLEFENNSAHLVLDNATLHITNSGLMLKKGVVDIYNKSNFVVDYTDTTVSKTTQALVFGDGLTSANDPTLILHGNGTNLTISNGAIVLDAYNTSTLLQFDGQAQMSLVETISLYFKKPVNLVNGWIRPATNISFDIAPNSYVTADNVRFDYTDIFADYNVTGTLLNPLNTILDTNDYIFVNRGNSLENLTITGTGIVLSGLGGPLGTISLEQGSDLTWDVAGVIGINDINLNGNRFVIAKNVLATPGFTFKGTGSIDIGEQVVALGTESAEWDGKLYWIGNGGILRFNSDVVLSGNWTFSGSMVVDGNGYIIDLDQTGSIILERGAKVEFQNTSINNLSRQNPVTCSDNNCEITLNFVDLLFGGDYLFDKGSLYLYYDSYFGAFGGLDTTFTFTYASTQTSTIDSQCILGIWPNMRFSIGRQNSTITNPEHQPLVFSDPLTSKLILDGGTLHITSSGMILTKGIMENRNTSAIEVDTSKYEYGLILGDGTLDNDFGLEIKPGTQLNIKTGRIFYQNFQNNRIMFGSPASSLRIEQPGGFTAKTDVTLSNGWIRPAVNTAFAIDPAAYLVADNLRFDYPQIFSDYNVTGTIIDSLDIRLGPNDNIAVTRGNSIENLIISGQGARLSGVGGPLGTITLDNTSSLTWDIANTIGIGNIDLNGGKIAITQDVAAAPGFTFQGTGTVNIGNQTFDLGSDATEWTGNIYWDSSGGTLKLNNNVTLSGIWTFSGNMVVEGNDYLIDFAPTGTIILERGAKVTFQHMSLYNMSRQTPIVCSDNNCQITLNVADMLLSGDYLFDKGSIFVYYNSTVGVIDGLDGTYTFTYASTQTSTIDTYCYFKILPGTRFSIGRQDSTITDPERQQLVFIDPLTSKLILDGGTLHVTSSGMRLTKGTLNVANTSAIEVDTPKYEYGLILGDGSLDNDFDVEIEPGVQLNVKTGSVYYENYNNDRIVFGSPASSLEIESPTGFVAKTDITLKNGTIVTDNSTDIAITADEGVNAVQDNITRIYRGTIYSLQKRTIHGGLRPYRMLNGDLYYITEGHTTNDVIAAQGTSYFAGNAGFSGTLTLKDHTVTLQNSMTAPLFCNIAMNGGTLVFLADGIFGSDKTLTGSGKVMCWGTNVSFGPKDTAMTSTLYWQGVTSGNIDLNSRTSLSSTWTFGGLMQINGNGNVLDLSKRGVLAVRPGATLVLDNMGVKGLGSGLGNITFMGDDSKLKLSNVYLELDNNFSTTIGGIIIDGPSCIGLKQYNWTLDQKASMTIDGVTLWQDTLDSSIHGSIRFGSGSIDKYLTLVSSGTIKTAANADALTVDTSTLEEEIANNSNALLYCCRTTSNALLFGDRVNSRALLFGDRVNSNAIIKLGVDVRTTSNSLLFGDRVNSRALLYGDRVNSNAIMLLDRKDRTDSNALLACCRTTSNALLFGDRVNSRALLFGDRVNSNAIIKLGVDVRTTSNSLLFGDRVNSRALLFGDRVNSRALLFGDRVNSNAIIKLGVDVRTSSNALLYGDRVNSRALLFGDRINSNALLFGDRVNSNAIMVLNRNYRTDSNALLACCRITSNALLFGDRVNSRALLFGDRNNSNAIMKLGVDVRTTSNSLLFGDRVNSRALLYGDRVNSNAIVTLNRNYRTDSNALLACCRTTSNALLFGDRVNSRALLFGDRNNSNAIIKLGTDVRTNSNALLYCCRTTSNALLFVNRTNSNAIIKLGVDIRTTSNSLLFGDRVNSRALLYGDRINSNALLFGDRNNSNAIVTLNRNYRTDSNALLACCRTTSNALLFGDRVNSRALLFGDRNNSNAIMKLGVDVRTTSNSLLFGDRVNSNALLYGDRVNSNAIMVLNRNYRTDSNALLACCRTTSNALLFGDRVNSNAIAYISSLGVALSVNNSNAIMKLGVDVKSNSNALLFGDRIISNAWLYWTTNNSNYYIELVKQNSDTLIYLNRANSATTLYLTKNNSNALLYGDRINSDAIIKLDTDFRTHSNALLFGDRNSSNTNLYLFRINSNALLYGFTTNSTMLTQLSEGIKNNSNTLLYCCRTTSNALLFGDRVNSNALLSISATTSQFTTNNSNAIVWLDEQLDTIDHGPANIVITTTSYYLAYDIFLSADHLMTITSNTVIDGKGHTIHCAEDVPGIIQIADNCQVTLKNIVLDPYDDSVFLLGNNARVIFGDETHLILAEQQHTLMPWICQGEVEMFGDKTKVTINPLDDIVVLPHSTLSLHEIELCGLKQNNMRCSGSTSAIVLSDSILHIDNDFSFTSGSLTCDQEVMLTGSMMFDYASDSTLTVSSDSRLRMEGVWFNYQPPVANKGLFALKDRSAILSLEGCSLVTTTTGMQLTKGTLMVDHKNVLFNEGTSISEGFIFGNGNVDENLDIQMKPGGSFDVASGCLDYQNIDVNLF